jgi:phage repressor protein C with HTH and peptisase S24 domain
MGMSRGGFIKLERGENQLTSETISRAARVFQVTEAEVVSGPSVVPVMGRVGAGGTIETEWENLTEPLFEIELPFPVSEDAIGFEIEGNSMWPRYDPHDVIVVSKAGEPLDGLLGFEAVVRTGNADENGNRYLKRPIRSGAPGLYDLESYNAPVMRGLRIAWAAGIIAHVPASRWRRLNGKAVKTAMAKTSPARTPRGVRRR